ncbi:MAG: condensation domain-containing protein, partial [Pseudomonadota bacterium]
MNQPDSARHPRAIAARLAKLNPDQRERLAEKLLERGIDPVSLPIMPRGAADGPLSFGQERLWTLYRLEPESPKYNLFGGATLDGPLDVSALTRSIHWLIERHDVLRTRLIERDGVGVQVIDAPSESAPFEVDYADARGDPFALDDEIERVRAVPFDLTVGPCFRIRLLRVEDERHAMLMAVHHAVADAWSLGIILREIDTAYRAFSTGDTPVTPPLPIQFADYATWERQWQTEAALAPSFAYWRNRLDGVPDAITLPVPSAVRRVDERIGHVVSRTCSSDVGEVLGTFMRDVQLTPYMFFLTVFQLLLHRWSDQRTLCVGSSLAARPRPETESLIGFFVNTIVMRSDFDPSEAAIDFFRRRRDEIVLDLDHRNMPVEQLVAALRPDRARAEHPLFNILFVMQNAPRGDGSLSNVRIEPLTTSTRFARFDLSLRMSQDSDNTFTAGLEYDTGLMDAAMASAILDGVFSLATSVAREPQRSVATVSMTPQSSPAPASQLAPQHWVDAIVDQAARTPMMTALQAKDAACTYADFVGRASRLAAHLRREGFQRQMPVGVLCPRDIDAVVAMFAAVRAGGYFVPLDPGWPSERLNTMVAALGMTWLITDDPEDEWVRASGLRIVSARVGVDVEPHEPSASPAADSELAYVMFTSGSTGRPKGCAITHCNLSHYVAGIVDRLNWAEQSHAAWASTVAADLGYTTVWTTLATGGTLHIYDDEEALLAEPLAARMCAHPVDVMKLAPSHLKALLAQTERPLSILPRRTLILGGEPFDESLRDTLHGIAPTLNLVNHYGPTETTIGVCTGAVRAGAPIALGELLPHVDGYALDAYGMVLPDGLVGEFYVSGASVANGYLNQGGLTAAAFVPHPKAIGERLYRTGDRV